MITDTDYTVSTINLLNLRFLKQNLIELTHQQQLQQPHQQQLQQPNQQQFQQQPVNYPTPSAPSNISASIAIQQVPVQVLPRNNLSSRTQSLFNLPF